MASSKRGVWWERIRTTEPAIALTVALSVFAAACGGGLASAPPTSSTRGAPRTTAATEPKEATAPTATTIAPHDGSLGDANTSRACTLLDAGEIEAQFGGPVGAPTPIYPYCQWLVGDGSDFVAVTIIPMPIEDARNVYEVRFDVDGVSEDSYIASTRAIVFGKNGVSYSILWQQVGDFTTVETERLSALAQNVLARV